jgi:hypothetical protein
MKAAIVASKFPTTVMKGQARNLAIRALGLTPAARGPKPTRGHAANL